MTQDPKPRPISTIGRMIELLNELEVDTSKLYSYVTLKSGEDLIHARAARNRNCPKAVGAYRSEETFSLSQIWEFEKEGKVCLFCSSHHRATGVDHAFWDSPNKVTKLLKEGVGILQSEGIKNLDDFKNFKDIHAFKVQIEFKKESFEKLDLREDEIGKISEVINKLDEIKDSYISAIRSDPKFITWLRDEIRKDRPFLPDLPHYLKVAEQAEEIRAQHQELEIQAAKFHTSHYCIRPKPRKYKYYTDIENAILDCWGKYSNILMLPLDIDLALDRQYGEDNHDDTVILDSEPLAEHLEALDVFFNPNSAESVLSLPEAYEAAKAV